MTAPISKAELLAIMTARARLAPERSHALPASSYRDPAESVKLEADKPKVRKQRMAKVNKKWR